MSRFGTIILYLSIWTMMLAGSSLAGEPAQPDGMAKAPRAVFPQSTYTFDELFEGVKIKHDFIVENQGNAPLVIKNIRPD